MVPFTGFGKTGKVTGFEGKINHLFEHIDSSHRSDFKYICQEVRV